MIFKKISSTTRQNAFSHPHSKHIQLQNFVRTIFSSFVLAYHPIYIQANGTRFFVCFFRYPLLPDLICLKAIIAFGSDFFKVKSCVQIFSSSIPVGQLVLCIFLPRTHRVEVTGIFIRKHDWRGLDS